MNRLAIVVAITFALTLSAMASEKQDITGWDKAKWGMTYKQIARLYQVTDLKRSKERQDKRTTCKLRKPLVILNREFIVEFMFNSKGFLDIVDLFNKNPPNDVMSEIYNTMIKKYGKPSKTKNVPIIKKREYIWTRKSGEVRLLLQGHPRKVGEGFISIGYQQFDRRSLDKI